MMGSKKLSHVTLPQALEYFSGHSGGAAHNHPCVGASSAGITVSCKKVSMTFRLDQFDMAMSFYKFCLAESGYKV
jgi:hypothetical protein